MFLLLLRLLTVPAPVMPAAVVTESAEGPAVPAAVVAAAPDPAALREARADLATVEAGPARIRRLMPAAGDRAVYAGCVAQRLAESQVHVSMARDEMQRLNETAATPASRSHARSRLALLAQRTREVEHAALNCVDEDNSSISATKKETHVPPPVQRRGDPTRPRPMAYPSPAGGASMVIPEP